MNKKKMSLFGFFAMTASMILTVYEYPVFATSQLQLVFYLVVAAFTLFIPVSLCSAEMASIDSWEKGGIFTWVSNTLGARWGFMAVFFQWIAISFGYVAFIYFMIGALESAFQLEVIESYPLLKFIICAAIFWIVTFMQFFGTMFTDKIAKFAFVLGIIFPSILLIVMGIIYLLQGHPLQMQFRAKDFFPHSTNLVFVSFVLAYLGVEASAPHINELDNPKRNYPLAIFILIIVDLILNIVGGLTIAMTVPKAQLSLSGGVVQSFRTILHSVSPQLEWLVPVITVIICIGVIGDLSSWIIGPSAGIAFTAEKGFLPKVFKKKNADDVPVPLIILQAVIVTIWIAITTLGGSGKNSDGLPYLIALTMNVLIYLSAYVLFFIGYLVLSFKNKNIKSSFKLPGGLKFKGLLGIIGLLTSAIALVVSFLPPSTVIAQDKKFYLIILVVFYVLIITTPVLIYQGYSKKNLKKQRPMSKE